MAASPNLKVKVGADTSGFDAGMKSAKQELRDFEKTGSDAFGALGSAIGLDTGKIGQLSNAAKALAGSFVDVGKKGSSAFTDMLPAIKSAAGAIAGLGLGAAAIAFKALTAEAEAFKQTVAGANIEMQTAAYVSTYKQALHDMNSATGQAVANFTAGIKKWWGRTKADVGYVGINFFNTDVSYEEIGNGIKNANSLAERSEQIAGKIYRFQRLISDRQVEISELDAQIAEYRRVALDKTTSTAERQNAVAQATALIKQKYEGANGLIMLNTALADLMQEQNSLTKSFPAQIDAANQQRIKANSMVRAENDELRSLLRTQNSLNSAVNSEAASRAAAAKALKESRAAMTEWAGQSAVSGIALPSTVSQQTPSAGILPFTPVVNNWSGFFTDVDGAIFKQWPSGMKIGVTWDYEEGLIDFTQAVESTLSSLADTTGTLIGQLVGDLATGGDAWGNFANTALSAFGDMAISVGKMAIATGTATLGIKAALESLNGWVAIAAGVALVALGTAVKTGLSNVANGNYGASMASAPVASSNYGNYNDYSTREMNINVTGTLTGDGDQLVAVINGTEKKNTLMT